jgi:2-amino-4-hydroxy-6-hydroxymethyldihydropteridine diphosphokinase
MIHRHYTRAYVALGGNLDQPAERLLRVFNELAELPHTRLVARSSLYRSRPVGYAEQPDFINAVAAVDTALDADRLMAMLLRLETRHGRQRSYRNAPRTLDLDLLLYGSLRQSTLDLTLPHPRMHQRAFVLRPLAEIAPHLELPGHGQVASLAAACPDRHDVQRLFDDDDSDYHLLCALGRGLVPGRSTVVAGGR